MSRNRSWIATLATFLAAAGLLWLLTKIGWSALALHLRRIGWTGALALFLGGLIEAVFDALALRAAALNSPRFWSVFFLNQAGAALNTVIPGEAGEVLKASLLSKEAPGKAVSAVLVWNIACKLSKSVVIVLAAATAWLALPLYRDKALLAILLGLMGLVVFFAINITMRRHWISRLLARLTRLVFSSAQWPLALIAKVRHVEKTSGAFWSEHPRSYLLILLYQIMARVLYIATLWVALDLIGAYSFSFSLLIFALTELVGFLLPALPTRVGTTEGSAYLLFLYLGLDGGVGVIFQLVMRIKQISVNLISCLLGISAGRLKPVVQRPQSASIQITVI